MAEADVMPGLTIVLAGTLDDPAAYTPSMEIYCSSAQQWFHADTERKRFPKVQG
jgi:hypothetical protein